MVLIIIKSENCSYTGDPPFIFIYPIIGVPIWTASLVFLSIKGALGYSLSVSLMQHSKYSMRDRSSKEQGRCDAAKMSSNSSTTLC